MNAPRPRSIPIATPARCGTCRRAVFVVETPGHLALIERDPDGRTRPHACPDQAVTDYFLRETLRRLGDRRAALSRRPRAAPASPLGGDAGESQDVPPQPVAED